MDSQINALIVDDVAAMRHLMRIVIEGAGNEIQVCGEAASGPEALESIEDCDPDVVVLDQMMPGMDGIATAASIRARRARQPIILFSAYLDDDREEEAQAMGLTVLSKIDFSRLPARIRDICNGVPTA